MLGKWVEKPVHWVKKPNQRVVTIGKRVEMFMLTFLSILGRQPTWYKEIANRKIFIKKIGMCKK